MLGRSRRRRGGGGGGKDGIRERKKYKKVRQIEFKNRSVMATCISGIFLIALEHVTKEKMMNSRKMYYIFLPFSVRSLGDDFSCS